MGFLGVDSKIFIKFHLVTICFILLNVILTLFFHVWTCCQLAALFLARATSLISHISAAAGIQKKIIKGWAKLCHTWNYNKQKFDLSNIVNLFVKEEVIDTWDYNQIKLE